MTHRSFTKPTGARPHPGVEIHLPPPAPAPPPPPGFPPVPGTPPPSPFPSPAAPSQHPQGDGCEAALPPTTPTVGWGQTPRDAVMLSGRIPQPPSPALWGPQHCRSPAALSPTERPLLPVLGWGGGPHRAGQELPVPKPPHPMEPISTCYRSPERKHEPPKGWGCCSPPSLGSAPPRGGGLVSIAPNTPRTVPTTGGDDRRGGEG